MSFHVGGGVWYYSAMASGPIAPVPKVERAPCPPRVEELLERIERMSVGDGGGRTARLPSMPRE